MEKLSVGIPTGIIFPFAGTVEPEGFMFCDGRSLSRAAYPGLFSIIGTSHGAVDGASFNIPDYRGRFLRGVDGAAGRDTDKGARTAMNAGGATGNAVGTVQGQATRKNGLALSDPGHGHSTGGRYMTIDGGTAYNPQGGGGTYYYRQDVAANTTGITLGNGDSETRPINAYVNFIIKV